MATKKATKRSGSKKLSRAKKVQPIKPLSIYMKHDSIG